MTADRYVLITGASGGVGQALARRMREDGWRFALAGRGAARLRDAHPGCEELLISGDASTPGTAASLLRQWGQHFGRPPDGLGHCVGAVLVAPLHRTRSAQYRACRVAKPDSALHTLSAWISALREAKQPGTAVFGSSAAARTGTPNQEAVAAAKGGVKRLVRAAARVTGRVRSLDGGFSVIRPLVR